MCSQTLSGIKLCKPDYAFLPSRCLKLEEVGQQCYFRLEDTGNRRGAYLILSHRWKEGAKRCRTTKENLDARMSSSQPDKEKFRIELLELGPACAAFLDAVELASRLGITYLWIDSLCIVQDDIDDWEQESVKMAAYW